MGYLNVIETSFFYFPIVAFFSCIPYFIHEYHKYGSVNILKMGIFYSFILYLLTIYFLVILPLPNKEEVKYIPNMIRLIPFSFIKDLIRESSFIWNNPSTYLKSLTDPCFYTVFFNILMTIPFGMYLRYYFKYNLKKTIWYTFCLSLFFEITQLTGLYFIYPYPYRVFDIDDLIVNTLGGFIGYHFVGLFLKFLPPKEKLEQNALLKGKTVSGLRRILIFIFDYVIYLLLILLFFPLAHKKTFLIIFCFYYIGIPYKKGSTWFGNFLKVRMCCQKNKWLSISIRSIFLHFYYIFLPPIITIEIYKIIYYLKLSSIISLIFYMITFLSFLCFYFLHFFLLIKNKKMFYDSWFSITLESTIKDD